MSNNNRPIHEIRLGRIKAAIWQNETEHGTRHSVTLSRLYRTDAGWESTSSFGREDLPLVAKVADLAHSWLYQQNGDRDESAAQQDRQTKSARKETSAAF